MQVDVQLDHLKLKGAKRAHFFLTKDSQQRVNLTVPNTNELTCEELKAFVIVSKLLFHQWGICVKPKIKQQSGLFILEWLHNANQVLGLSG